MKVQKKRGIINSYRGGGRECGRKWKEYDKEVAREEKGWDIEKDGGKETEGKGDKTVEREQERRRGGGLVAGHKIKKKCNALGHHVLPALALVVPVSGTLARVSNAILDTIFIIGNPSRSVKETDHCLQDRKVSSRHKGDHSEQLCIDWEQSFLLNWIKTIPAKCALLHKKHWTASSYGSN